MRPELQLLFTNFLVEDIGVDEFISELNKLNVKHNEITLRMLRGQREGSTEVDFKKFFNHLKTVKE